MSLLVITICCALSTVSRAILAEVAALSVAGNLPQGAPCDFGSQCAPEMHCADGRCRKWRCERNSDCARGERCRMGSVAGELQKGCFSLESVGGHQEDFCPGDGLPARNSGGFIETCDTYSRCVGKSVCNPVFGVCCNRLRACPFPRKAAVAPDTGLPVICQMREGNKVRCPEGSECIDTTGFCCMNEDSTMEAVIHQVGSRKPIPGFLCNEGEECGGNAVCECENGSCRCECMASLGYALDKHSMTCKRIRRKLRERCKYDMDCQAAFSECTSGGCRCKDGFQRDGQNGCSPVAYRCVNHAEPLRYDKKIVRCEALKNPLSPEVDAVDTLLLPETSVDKHRQKPCPSQYYCVPIFDLARDPDLFQGFCCPLPTPERPVCPVGNAHLSSQPPDYGCRDCPWDHYCHQDNVATNKHICCPKPCLSPEDVYLDGQCYPIAYHGDSCFVSDQCVGKLPAIKEPPMIDEFISKPMECMKNVCQCPQGFSFVSGACRKLQCTVGTRGEPVLDSTGVMEKCQRNSQCSQGSMCDPNIGVCCHGTNRCPKDYVEIGVLCERNNPCPGVDEVCVRIRKGRKRICCRPEP